LNGLTRFPQGFSARIAARPTIRSRIGSTTTFSAREEAEMLSKCANPGCAATFLYLHEGKLFRLDTSVEVLACTPVREMMKPSRRIEFFWLCSECAGELTLGYNKGAGITVVSLRKELAQAASAPLE
jgi:hypothetical protein